MHKGNPWISFPAPRPKAHTRLFCLPYGGGGAAAYFPWLKYLPEQIELCPIRLPGRESRLREPALSCLEILVDQIVLAIEPYLDKPFAIFGHSMGALIGFELLDRLEKLASPLRSLLFASSRRAPHLPEPDPPIHNLPDPVFIREIQNRYNGIPEAILHDRSLMELFLPTLRADIQLIETYTYTGNKLSSPIISMGGMQDRRVSPADLQAWQIVTGGDFQMQLFQGDHFYLQSKPEQMAQVILSGLEKTMAGVE